jgi:hypothetical protein
MNYNYYSSQNNDLPEFNFNVSLWEVQNLWAFHNSRRRNIMHMAHSWKRYCDPIKTAEVNHYSRKL